MVKSQKNLIIIFIILIIFFIYREIKFIPKYETPLPIINSELKFSGNETVIGNLYIVYPKLWQLIETNNSAMLALKPKNNHELNPIISDLGLLITYLKDANIEKLNLEKWIKENTNSGMENDQGKIIKLGSIEAYRQYYRMKTNNEDDDLSKVVITFRNNSDIYEIFFDEMPTSFNSEFKKEDIQAAREYEAIVEDILQNITFVE